MIFNNPRGGKYTREVIFAFLHIAKIAKFCASQIKLTPNFFAGIIAYESV